MSKIEEYKNAIIEQTALTKIEIDKLVEDKKAELKGLISDEGAFFMICKELNVTIPKDKKFDSIGNEKPLQIKDVNIANLKNLTLTGRIVSIREVHEFQRKDGKNGKVLNFTLEDSTGRIGIVVWDDMTDIINDPKFEKNALVQVTKGGSKWSDYHNKYEINIPKWGLIIIDPPEINPEDFKEVNFQEVTFD